MKKNNLLFIVLTMFILFQFFGCNSPKKTPDSQTDISKQKEPLDFKKIAVVIDTDMGFDDWMAILYVLNRTDVDVKAITVDCTGETHCPDGAENATKLLLLAGKSDIPVYFGNEPAATLPYQFPAPIRESATAMDVPGFNNIPGTKNYKAGAADQLVTLAIKAGEKNNPLTILSIGTSTNIAQAIEQSKELGNFESFAKGINMIYKGGGAVGETENDKLTNNNIPGNLNIPGLFSSNNKTAAWNIFANAQGAETLFISGLPLTQIPVNLSDQVNITESSFNKLKKNAKTEAAKFVVSDILINVNSQGGFEKEELDYWDPSVVVAALNPDFITNKYEDVQICVDTNKGNAHGTTFVNMSSGTSTTCSLLNLTPGKITVYTSIDTDKFYEDFENILNR